MIRVLSKYILTFKVSTKCHEYTLRYTLMGKVAWIGIREGRLGTARNGLGGASDEIPVFLRTLHSYK